MDQGGIPTYVIRGGSEGRERLRALARLLVPTTDALFDRIGIPTDARCLDVGCGGVPRDVAGDFAVQRERKAAAVARVIDLLHCRNGGLRLGQFRNRRRPAACRRIGDAQRAGSRNR